MALPILNNILLHELTVPSTGKTHNFRPYLVKEEKILLQAKESKDDKLMMKSVAKIIANCVEGINVNQLTNFDVEYLFVVLRSKSSGELVDLMYKCPECDHENDIKVDLNKVKMNHKATDINFDVKITDDISITMGFLNYENMVNRMNHKKKDNTAEGFKLITQAIVSVNTDEERIIFADESMKDQEAFIDSLSSEQFQTVSEFISNCPTVSYTETTKCTACKKDFEVDVKGLANFF